MATNTKTLHPIGVQRAGHRQKLLIVFSLTIVYLIVEIIMAVGLF